MILGIDIGGTNIKFGVVTDDFTLLEKWSIPTGVHRGAEAIIADINAMAQEIRKTYSIDRIGVGSPGDIDSENGVCVRASNLPYSNTPIAAMINAVTGLPVTVSNDATAALYGELYAGAGKAFQNIVMITLGTGVGGGIAINGKPYLGSNGYAGEIGHLIIKYDGLACPCGMVGCYEQYASVTALIRQTREAIAANPDSLLARIAGGEPSGLSVFEAKAQGCPVAEAMLTQYAKFIAIGIDSLKNIFQPDAMIIGGAISSQEDNLLDPIRAQLDKPVTLLTSTLKNDAGIIGAAVAAAKLA